MRLSQMMLILGATALIGAGIPGKKKVARRLAETSVGRPFPAFSGTTLQNRAVDNSMFKDHVTLVSLWRIGCTWCMLEIPVYNALGDSIRDPRFQIFSMAPHTMDELVSFYSDDTTQVPALVRQAIGAPPPAYDALPMCSTKREKDPYTLSLQCDALEDLLGVDGYPVTFIVGPDGVIQHRHVGMYVDPVTYKPNMRSFLHELDSLLHLR